MKITVEAQGGLDAAAATLAFKGSGERDGTSIFNGRIVLARYNLTDQQPALAAVDQQIIQGYRQEFARLWTTGH